jgi:hypothetical protein
MLPIGGPGPAYSAKEQADLLFKLAGLPPNYFPVPVALMDGIIGILDFLARLFPDKFEVGQQGQARLGRGAWTGAGHLGAAPGAIPRAPAQQQLPRGRACAGSAPTPPHKRSHAPWRAAGLRRRTPRSLAASASTTRWSPCWCGTL